jgi:hypothetical protein
MRPCDPVSLLNIPQRLSLRFADDIIVWSYSRLHYGRITVQSVVAWTLCLWEIADNPSLVVTSLASYGLKNKLGAVKSWIQEIKDAEEKRDDELKRAELRHNAELQRLKAEKELAERNRAYARSRNGFNSECITELGLETLFQTPRSPTLTQDDEDNKAYHSTEGYVFELCSGPFST